MSYASVTAHNSTHPSQQPHPSTALLNTSSPAASTIVDDSAKANIVPRDFESDPITLTSINHASPGPEDASNDFLHDKRVKKRNAKKHLQEAEAESLYFWNITENYILRPGVAGGLIGLVNIGLIVGAGRVWYTHPHLRRDTKVISSVVAATIALLSVEGLAAEKYRKTSKGQEEERRVKDQGSIIYRQLHKHILRPGIAGGLLGLVNAAILGTVSYFSYINWDKPKWDRCTMSVISACLLAIWGGEGYIVEQIRK